MYALGDASADAARLARAMQDLNHAIALAERAGQTEAARQLRVQLATVTAQYRALTAQAATDEAPSGIAVTFDRFADTVKRYAKWGGILAAGVVLIGLFRRARG